MMKSKNDGNEKPSKNKKRQPERDTAQIPPGNARAKKERDAAERQEYGGQEKRRRSEQSDKQTDKAKRKKTPHEPKAKRNNKRTKKELDREELIDNMSYGDDFYTDEVELKRKRARQKLDEKKLPEFDIEKKPLSHKKRKLKNAGFAATVVSIILIIGIVLSLTVFFRSEQFAVEGAERYSAQDIIDASGLKLGENLFLTDKGAGEDRIESALPYVEEAKISIRIPNTMVITVTESKPAFIFKSGGNYIIVSSQGKVMEKIEGKNDKYDAPLVLGCTVKSAELGKEITFKESGILKILMGVAKGLSDNEFSGIKEIDITNTARICLNYANRIKIVIGLPEDISYKLKTAKIIISDKLSETDAGELDVSGCKEKNKASYFKPDASIYIDRIEATQPITQPETNPTTEPTSEAPSDIQTETQQEYQTDMQYEDYPNGVPQYDYPTDAYGNVIYPTDSDSSYDTGYYDNAYGNENPYGDAQD